MREDFAAQHEREFVLLPALIKSSGGRQENNSALTNTFVDSRVIVFQDSISRTLSFELSFGKYQWYKVAA